MFSNVYNLGICSIIRVTDLKLICIVFPFVFILFFTANIFICFRSLSNLEMAVENATIRAIAEQPLQTLNIELSAEKIIVYGTSIIKSESIQHQSDFRFTKYFHFMNDEYYFLNETEIHLLLSEICL